MAAEYLLEIDGIEVHVVRKRVKNLNFTVYPPDGRVRVSVPVRISKKAIRDAVISRLDWIRRKQDEIRQRPKQLCKEMVSGEGHLVQGRVYRLEVVRKNGKASVVACDGDTLRMQVPPGTGREQREALLQQWYRQLLLEMVPVLLDKWEPVVGVRVSAFGIRRMKTRWGSCNIVTRRVWLNLELARMPVFCLEYVLVHEMTHILERGHNQRFWSLMDNFLPQWKKIREQLNSWGALENQILPN